MRRLILIALSSAAMGSAQAADLPTYHSPIDAYEPAPASNDAAAGFNWNSYFVGASGLIGATDPLALGGDVFVGVTATAGDFVYGGVLSAGALSSNDSSFHVELSSRFGVVLTDDVVAYATVGGGYETEFEAPYSVLGAGLSVAVADNMTIEAGLKGNYLTGAPGDGEWRLLGSLGVAFHF